MEDKIEIMEKEIGNLHTQIKVLKEKESNLFYKISTIWLVIISTLLVFCWNDYCMNKTSLSSAIYATVFFGFFIIFEIVRIICRIVSDIKEGLKYE